MDNLLHSKKAVITGGTSGIGREIAIIFAKEGADVIIFGSNEERGKEVLERMDEAKAFPDQNFLFYQVDVSDCKAVEKIFEKIFLEDKRVDILVNNAGITRDNLLLRMSEEDWDKVIDVNLKSLYNTCKAAVRPMMKARSGKIIAITSVVGLTGNPGQVNYAASKSGMIGFIKSLAKELAGRGINANCIAPGYIRTPMTDKLPEAVQSEIISRIPLNRMGASEDIANAALFLASDLSNYITGQVITVDGGMVM